MPHVLVAGRHAAGRAILDALPCRMVLHTVADIPRRAGDDAACARSTADSRATMSEQYWMPVPR